MTTGLPRKMDEHPPFRPQDFSPSGGRPAEQEGSTPGREAGGPGGEPPFNGITPLSVRGEGGRGERSDLPLASAIYEGRLRHRRRSPKKHEFSYSVYMVYLDLAEAESALGDSWLTSATGRALFSFRRRDYLGEAARPLEDCVRDLVAARIGRRPAGPIRLLANLACLGTNFNPVAFYYCYGADGERLEAVVADIVNTPWGERHAYVLDCAHAPEQPGPDLPFSFALDKDFHVSPFFKVEQQYAWKFLRPGPRLLVHMENFEAGDKVFDATLSLERRAALSPRALLACQLRHPLMGLRVLAYIYFQAARLFAKKIPFVPHPRRAVPPVARPEIVEDL